jgi:hypothetical protein
MEEEVSQVQAGSACPVKSLRLRTHFLGQIIRPPGLLLGSFRRAMLACPE